MNTATAEKPEANAPLTVRPTDHLVVIIGFDDPEGVQRTVGMLTRFDRAPDILVIENGRSEYGNAEFDVVKSTTNRGYTGAANQGIQLGFNRGYAFVTIANTDLDIDAESFRQLRSAMDASPADVAVLGGIELTGDGSPNTAGGLSWSRWTGSDRWTKEIGHGNEMLFVQGAFVTVSRAILAVDGPFDESLFMFFDEIELGIRVRKAGLRSTVVRGLRYRHDNAGGRYRPLRGYLIWRNRALVSRRHSGLTAPLNHAVGLARLLCGVVARFPEVRADYTTASLRGWCDGVRGITDLTRVPGIKYLDTVSPTGRTTQPYDYESSPCPLCDSPGRMLYARVTDRVHRLPGSWSTAACTSKHCDAQWITPRPSTDSILGFYSAYATHKSADTEGAGRMPPWYPSPISRHERRERSRTILPRELSARRAGKLFEIGCGNGVNLVRLRSLGWTVAGQDFDPAAVAVARKAGLDVCESMTGGTGEADRFGAYDVVLLSHVIEHVEDVSATLATAASLLASGGSLVIMTPNGQSISAKLFRSAWRGLEAPRHLQVFGPRSLHAAIVKEGFTEVRVGSSYASDGYLAGWSVAPGAPTRVTLGFRGVASVAAQVTADVAFRWFGRRGGELVATATRP